VKDLTRGSSGLEFASGFVPRSKKIIVTWTFCNQNVCVPCTYLPQMGAVMYIAFISLDL
jgi:hypothetical protein